MFFLWFVSFSNAEVIPYIFLLEAKLGNTPHLSSHELAYTTPVDTSRFLWVQIYFLYFLIIYGECPPDYDQYFISQKLKHRVKTPSRHNIASTASFKRLVSFRFVYNFNFFAS